MTAGENKLLCCTLAMIALMFGEDARAADFSTTPRETRDTKAPSDVPAATPLRSGWTGFYVGAHAGVSGGYSAWSATQPGGPDLSGSLHFFTPYDVFMVTALTSPALRPVTIMPCPRASSPGSKPTCPFRDFSMPARASLRLRPARRTLR